MKGLCDVISDQYEDGARRLPKTLAVVHFDVRDLQIEPGARVMEVWAWAMLTRWTIPRRSDRPSCQPRDVSLSSNSIKPDIRAKRTL